MASTPAFEPRTHLKEASALTNAPPLLPLFISILAGNQPLHAVYLGLLQVCRTDNVSESEIKLVVVGVVRTWVDSSTEYRTFTVVFHDKGAKAFCSRYTRYQSLAHGSRTLHGKQERIWWYGLGMAMELSVNLLGNKLKSNPDGPFSTCPRLTQDLPTRRL